VLLELPICVQWWVGDPAGAELDPADGLELDCVDVEDVVAVLVVAGVAEPVDASATPATPPPSAAPIAPVITSRRMRPDLLGFIWLLPQSGTRLCRARRRTTDGLRSLRPAWETQPGRSLAPTLSPL
jgi:hypothetical protein